METKREQLIRLINDVSEGLYQQNKEKGLSQVNQLVVELLGYIKEVDEDSNLSLNIQRMNQVLLEAMNALEAEDYVLLADILVYDLKDLLSY